jgi:hypothetical protein
MHRRIDDTATCGDEGFASPWAQRAALLLLAVLLVPAVRRALEATMLAQMLVQIPLLAVVGGLAQSFVTPAVRARMREWNANGIAGFVVASLATMYWMLPRTLDAAIANPPVDAVKYLSVPLLIGLPLSLSWPRAGFVARGILVTEAIATLLRLGWLYRISSQRLCSAYPLGDQQQAGLCMLVLGAVLFAVVAWRLLFTDRVVGAGRREGIIA